MGRDHKIGQTTARGLSRRRVTPVLLMVAASVAGCPTAELPADLGDCPDDSSVTWRDVEPVLADHCTRCHSSELVTPEERQDATEGVDFDTPEAARGQSWLAWSQVTTGRMPKDGGLADEDALILWEWWSCGGPE